jgi:hypothetical protein
MKKLQLQENMFTLVSDEDFDFLNRWKWYAVKNGYGRSFYVSRNSSGKTIYLHKLILNDPGKIVDHINHDGLDNRRENLRYCSASQNRMNMKMQSNNTSGYKGVSWTPSGWKAQIKVDGRVKTLGRFKNILEAAQRYDDAAKTYFKEFAYVNFA